MSRLDFIPHDGYTEQGYLAPLENIHGPFRFAYRPMLVEEQSALLGAMDEMAADKYQRKCAHEMAKRLASWSVVDAGGDTVEITPLNVLRLKPSLFGKLFGVIAGTRASDQDPQWDEETKNTDAGEEYESAVSGKPIVSIREEEHIKN